MGVDYSVALGVGVLFRNRHDAQNFFRENVSLDDITEEEMEEEMQKKHAGQQKINLWENI